MGVAHGCVKGVGTRARLQRGVGAGVAGAAHRLDKHGAPARQGRKAGTLGGRVGAAGAVQGRGGVGAWRAGVGGGSSKRAAVAAAQDSN